MAAQRLPEDLRRQIGQHFVFGFHGYDLTDDIITLIRDYYVGNVILFKRNVQSIKQVYELTKKLQQLAKDAGHTQPLLIGIDQENGLVSAFSVASGEAGTQFPGAMALAASGDIELANEVSLASGKELKAAGINWAYSPVADVNSDSRNPVIGVRSYGDEPKQAAAFANAVSEGLISAGVASCAKHFPGHGDTHVDSHLALPQITKSQAELDATELVPFRLLAANNIPSIMTGHMALPKITGSDLPASLSPAISRGLLRGDLKYEGVIVTDCLEMNAVAETYTSERGAVMALEAGADIAMVCHSIDRQKGALELTYDAVDKGTLSLDTLASSTARISHLKSLFAGTWGDVLGGAFDDAAVATLRAENRALSARAYASSTAVIRTAPWILPLSRAQRPIALFTPRAESVNAAVDDPEGLARDPGGRVRNTAGPAYLSLARALARRTERDQLDHFVYGPDDGGDPPALASEDAVVVFATRNADTSAWQAAYLRQLLARLAGRSSSSPSLVLLSSCAPYDVLGSGEATLQISSPHAAVATFEFTAPAFEAAVAVMFGEAEAKGRVPVRAGAVH